MTGIDQNLLWAMVLLVFGLACIVLEMFLPSGGMLGVLSALSLISALVLAFISGLHAGLFMTLAVTLLVPLLLAITIHYWPRTPMGKQVILPLAQQPDDVLPRTRGYVGLKQLIGSLAVARSEMLPGGVVEIEGKTYDAVSHGLPINAGQMVRVVGIDTQRLVVRAETAEPPSASPRTAVTTETVLPGIEDPFA